MWKREIEVQFKVLTKSMLGGTRTSTRIRAVVRNLDVLLLLYLVTKSIS
jgi:hypothetical protein